MIKTFVLLLLAVAMRPITAQESLPLDPLMGITTIPLYSDSAQRSADAPTLTVFLPQPGKGTGSAIVIAPGGAYLHLASNLEGRQVADWFTARGVTAFVLKYRLGGQNIYPKPLLDAQRAIRLVRSLSKEYAIAPNRIGIIGFSAGGHLAATAATLYDSAAATVDSVDALSSRPDFVVLGYPWLNAMEPQVGKEITYCSMIHEVSPAQCKDFATTYTPRLHATRQTPPTFIYATTDDQTVPVSASTAFYDAMVKAGAPVEMHLFKHGAHGSGLGMGDAALDRWPELMEQWMRDLGLLTRDTSITSK